MHLDIDKETLVNVNDLKQIKYKKTRKTGRYFLESKGADVFATYKKMTTDDFNRNSIFSTSFGTFFAVDRGEFGGNLFKVEKRYHKLIYCGNIKELVDLKDKLFYVDSCAHMMGRFSYGFFSEDDSQYHIEELFEKYGEYSISTEFYNGNIFILTCDNIYLFNPHTCVLSEFLKLKDIGINYLSEIDVGNTLIKNSILYIGLADAILCVNLETKDAYFLG